MQQQQERKEFDACTFKPDIHDAPQYIKRIARSMKVARSGRPVRKSEKPQWK